MSFHGCTTQFMMYNQESEGLLLLLSNYQVFSHFEDSKLFRSDFTAFQLKMNAMQEVMTQNQVIGVMFHGQYTQKIGTISDRENDKKLMKNRSDFTAFQLKMNAMQEVMTQNQVIGVMFHGQYTQKIGTISDRENDKKLMKNSTAGSILAHWQLNLSWNTLRSTVQADLARSVGKGPEFSKNN